jgi:hypothetical protein
MKPINIIGFTDRKYYNLQNRLLSCLIPLSELIPFFILLSIDITGKWKEFIPFIAFIPPIILHLTMPLWFWYEYVRFFGLPPFQTCWQMWHLDSLTSYRNNPGNRKRHVLYDAFIFAVISAIFALLWRSTGYSCFLYLMATLLVFAIRAPIRRARPPAILLLGSSSYNATRLQMELSSIFSPSLIVSGLHHRNAMVNVSGLFSNFRSARTVEYNNWQSAIISLMQLSQILIIYARTITDPVRYEIDHAVKILKPDQYFLIGTNGGSVPSDRCFTEKELIKELESKFRPARKTHLRMKAPTHYKDRKNGYFRFTLPEGWGFREYPDPRTKVKFFNRAIPEIHILFIVKENLSQNFLSLLLETQKNLRKTEATLGASCRINMSEFLGRETVEVMIDYADGAQGVLRLFIANGLLFSIQFYAPDKETFNTFLDEVNHSLETIELLDRRTTTQREELVKETQQQIARNVRVAEFYADMIDVDEARNILSRLSVEHPDNKQIRRAIEDLDRFSSDNGNHHQA